MDGKGAELSAKSIGNFLHKVFKVFADELKNEFPNLIESGSEVSKRIG